jgi:hypothetical protein
MLLDGREDAISLDSGTGQEILLHEPQALETVRLHELV